jgi:hypothetical protein
MVNYILKKVIGKELIMYDRHRNTAPIADHADNKKYFVFWSLDNFWKSIPLKSKHKLKKGLSIQLHIIYNIINEQNPALSTPSP